MLFDADRFDKSRAEAFRGFPIERSIFEPWKSRRARAIGVFKGGVVEVFDVDRDKSRPSISWTFLFLFPKTLKFRVKLRGSEAFFSGR